MEGKIHVVDPIYIVGILQVVFVIVAVKLINLFFGTKDEMN